MLTSERYPKLFYGVYAKSAQQESFIYSYRSPLASVPSAIGDLQSEDRFRAHRHKTGSVNTGGVVGC